MLRLPRLSLRAKLLGAFGLVLLPVLVLLVANFQTGLKNRQDTILNNQLQTAQAVANQVSEGLDNAINFGWAVADNPIVQTMDPTILDPYLQDLQERTGTYGNISVFDAAGHNRGWGDPNQPATPRLSVDEMPYYRPYFDRTLATNRPTVSEVFLLRRPLAVGYVVSVPIRNGNGTPVGVVTLIRRADQLAALYAQFGLQPGQTIFLVDQTGRLAFDTGRPVLPYDESADFADFPPVQQALHGVANEQIQFTDPLLGDERLGAFVPTPRYPWAVGVTMATSVAMAPLETSLRNQLAGFGVILILSTLIAAALAHVLVKPVKRLESAAQELGAGNLTTRVQIHTGDELEQLGISFNQMAEQLAQRQTEVMALLDRERALAQIAQALVRELELPHVVDAIIQQSLRVLEVDAVAVWLTDPSRRELNLLAQRGFTSTTVDRLRHLSYDSPLPPAVAIRTGEIQFIATPDADEQSNPVRETEPADKEKMSSFLAIPLRARGRLVGVVAFAARPPRKFSPRDREFDATLADLFAVAIENAQLYEQLRNELHGREEFMAAAAHELRTPVTVIKGRAQFALRSDARDERTRQTLETILAQSNRIDTLTEGLLTVLRLRGGASVLNRTHFDLGQLVQAQLAKSAVPGIPTKENNLPIQTQIGGSLIVDADERLIGDVVDYLLRNAVLYSPTGRAVEVTTRREDGEAVFSIADHGPGIPARRQPFVFEPFYEAVPPGAPGYVGMVSLGLYLSKKIVEAHGGRIWLTSVPGQGATFSFSIPLAPGESRSGT
ncbi:MAG TPA: cache domain-containing protein [Chloroflexota bacterium]|nr:cache domain-containing protein [Chloroflexota bacterium]